MTGPVNAPLAQCLVQQRTLRNQVGRLVGWVTAATLAAAMVGPVIAQQSAEAADAEPAPRANRHALIIGIGRYQADPARPVETLHGVPHDLASARAIARRLQVPAEQTTVLHDAQATRAGIEAALAALRQRVKPGDRVFVYWSGHGSRQVDASGQGCTESLVPHDLQDIPHQALAEALRPIGDRADKLMVVVDACHSGSPATAGATRAWGGWRAKTAQGAAACQQISNLRHRGFEAAARAAGLGLGDVVHIASSRSDEVSFDHPDQGGLATQSLRRCLMGEAQDLDRSGALSVDELVQCAQARIEQALRGQPGLLPHHLTVAGNRGFVPDWFARPAAPAGAPPATPVAAPTVAATGGAPARPAPPRAMAPAALLAELHAQRDTRWRLDLQLEAPRLRIGSDALGLAVRSERAGHLYLLAAGSDGRSLHLLFPNRLDQDNRIEPGRTVQLPRPAWRLQAGGPPGRGRLLAVVAASPRGWSTLAGAAWDGPFLKPGDGLADAAALQRLLAQAGEGGCAGASCTDAFAAALAEIEEY